MELMKMTRKVKCKNCSEYAKFKVAFEKNEFNLCEECLKNLGRIISKITVPMPVVTKFYKKR